MCKSHQHLCTLTNVKPDKTWGSQVPIGKHEVLTHFVAKTQHFQGVLVGDRDTTVPKVAIVGSKTPFLPSQMDPSQFGNRGPPRESQERCLRTRTARHRQQGSLKTASGGPKVVKVTPNLTRSTASRRVKDLLCIPYLTYFRSFWRHNQASSGPLWLKHTISPITYPTIQDDAGCQPSVQSTSACQNVGHLQIINVARCSILIRPRILAWVSLACVLCIPGCGWGGRGGRPGPTANHQQTILQQTQHPGGIKELSKGVSGNFW